MRIELVCLFFFVFSPGPTTRYPMRFLFVHLY